MDFTAQKYDQNFLANLLAAQNQQNANLNGLNQEGLA